MFKYKVIVINGINVASLVHNLNFNVEKLYLNLHLKHAKYLTYIITLLKSTYLHNLVFIMAMKKSHAYKSNRPHIYQINANV